MKFTWDNEKRVYLDAEGREVPADRLRAWIAELAAALAVLFIRRAEAVRLTFLDVEDQPDAFRDAVRSWDAEIRDDLSGAHLAACALAFGGFANASALEYETGEAALRFQLGFWAAFIGSLATGALSLDDSFAARTGMYALAIFSTFENSIRARELAAGKTEERRRLGVADHCATCKEQAAIGWSPIGTLRAIGDSICLSRCHCFFEFR